jgi:hypothetical protein
MAAIISDLAITASDDPDQIIISIELPAGAQRSSNGSPLAVTVTRDQARDLAVALAKLADK